MLAVPAPSPSGRFAHAGVFALPVLVFAVVVIAVTLQLRAGLREQILRREAEKMAAAVSMQLDNTAEELTPTPLREAPAALFLAVLKTSKWPGVVGVRVFDEQRRLNSAWPFRWSDSPPNDDDWKQLIAAESIARLHPDLSADELIGLGPDERGLLEAWVPLRQSGTAASLGAAQFWIAAEAYSSELTAHDRRLWVQAAIAWFAGSAVILAALRWALRRLDAANRELRARSEDLQRANAELVLAAKTSALGAVTAHLMHELKNPIAGLEVLMAGYESWPRTDSGAGGELAAASELTRRLRTMVNDVVGVLRDEQTGAAFELSGADIVEVVTGKIQADAAKRAVKLETSGPAHVSLPARRANLATLVLRNLLQNALEATPAGGVVRLSGTARADGSIEFLVEDGGGGLPAFVRERLFQACTSTKIGGSGLGLALSHQLAHQAGGRLELVRSDARGTCFRLVLFREA